MPSPSLRVPAASALMQATVSTVTRLLGSGRTHADHGHALAADAVEIEATRRSLTQTRRLWLGFADNERDAVILLDRSLAAIHVSSMAGKLLRIERDGASTDDAFGMVRPDDRAALRATARMTLHDGTCHDLVCRVVAPDQSESWVNVGCRPVPMDGGILLVLRDMTDGRRTEARLTEALVRLNRLSRNDSLTGLPNRDCFLRTTDQSLASARPFAVLLIDLDRFKPVNDLYGHGIGDAVLQETAERLHTVLGTEPMIARLGGDEFAALLDAGDGDMTVAARARDIIRAIEVPFRIGVTPIDIGATIGIAMSGRDGDAAADLLRAADIAMAEAKRKSGSGYQFFETRMAQVLAESCALTQDLKSALANGEIVPYFQPLVRMETGAIDAFEVLARWHHPTRGLLPPMTFLPLIEAAGLSSAIFASLLTQSCQAARAWDPHIRLSVNISPLELHNEALPDEIAAILAKADFAGSRLEIEITENALVDDSRIARQVLDRIRALGITVALDDFGTGFSSLYHLRVLPFDKVKIDKSFISGLSTDPDDDRYVSAIIGLCHSLGLQMTAEGIEDTATMARLRELGCTYGQGFLFGRPVPAEEAVGQAIALAGGSSMAPVG